MIKISNYSFTSPGKHDISLLLSCRALSGLHGSIGQQNPPKNYLLRPNSIHSVATIEGKVVGYCIAQIWTTRRVLNLDWTKSYQTDLFGDTILISEIVVAEQAKGQNLGHRLLKSGVNFRNELFSHKSLQYMEMSVLSTNAASERMFSNFCREFGTRLTIGVANKSTMGTYINWNIALGESLAVTVGSTFDILPPVEKTLLIKRSNLFFKDKKSIG